MSSPTFPLEQRAKDKGEFGPSHNYCKVTPFLKQLGSELTRRDTDLRTEVELLRERLTRLECLKPEFESVRARLTLLESSKSEVTRIIRIKDVDFKTIKDEINRVIHEHVDGIDTLTLAEQLEVDPLLVLKAVDELKEEGKIDKAD